MKFFSIIFLAAALIGCDSGNKADTETTETVAQQPDQATAAAIIDSFDDQIMPLTNGNIWVFQLSGYDTITGEMVPREVDTFMVVNDTVFENEEWHYVISLGPNRGHAINREDGFWFMLDGQEPFLFAKFPVYPGDEYQSYINGVEVLNQVLETGLEVTVPAGTFTCYKYRQIFGPQKYMTDYYFSPGAGLIKTSIHHSGGEYMIFEAELIEKNF